MKLIKRLLVILLIFILICIFILYGAFYYASNEKHQPYLELIRKYSEEYNIEKELIFSVIKSESSFDKDAVSRTGAVGLMQIMPDTAKWIALQLNEEYKADSIKDPEVNIRYGTFYLSYLIGKFSNVDYAVMAYNAGQNNIQKWIDGEILNGNPGEIENIPFAETKSYIKKVKNNYKLSKKVYDFYYETNDNRWKRSWNIMWFLIFDLFR